MKSDIDTLFNVESTRQYFIVPEIFNISRHGQVNVEPLKKIGFSESQLQQLHNLQIITPEIVQESIHHFAYGLAHNPKTQNYDAPLNVLMGVLRKGEAWIESKYESPQVLAQRALLERKAKEQAALTQLRESAYQLAFEHWQASQSEEAKQIVIDRVTKGRKDIRPRSVRLDHYFREQVWPSCQGEYLVSEEANGEGEA